MDIEKEIDEILESIQPNEVRTFEEIESELQIGLDRSYENFLCFEKNLKNKILMRERLKNYEYIEKQEVKPGDYVKFVDKRFFFDMILSNGLVLKVNNDNILIKTYSKFKPLRNITNKHLFRKLTNNELLKITLIETINEEYE